MKKTPEYWRVLERVLLLQEVPAAWDEMLEDQGERLRPRARPTGDLSRSFPCPNPFGCRVPHEVRFWEDRVFAVSTEEDVSCKTIQLTREQVVRWELDRASVVGDACKLLNIHPGTLEPAIGERIYHIGCLLGDRGMPLQAYLVVPRHRKAFHTAVTALIATIESPFIVLSFSTQYLDPTAVDLLRRHGCAFFAIENLLACDKQGELVLLQTLHEQLGKPGQLATQEAPRNAFYKDGRFWIMTFEGITERVPERTAFHYICNLLREPGRHWPALVLVSLKNKPPIEKNEGMIMEAGLLIRDTLEGYAEPLLDNRARRELKSHLEALREEMADAELLHEEARLQSAKKEFKEILAQLAANAGEGGIPRLDRKEVRRASDSVSKAIERAYAHIAHYHPKLAEHLEKHINFGYSLTYTAIGMKWQTECPSPS